jgi:hypothetical protein
MIAPARLAAYEILLLSPPAAPIFPPPSLTRGNRSATTAIAPSPLKSPPASSVSERPSDYLIAHFAKRPLPRLDLEVVEILRLSAYQLLHLSRVPASAVVDDAVKLTGKAGQAQRERARECGIACDLTNRSAVPARPAGR